MSSHQRLISAPTAVVFKLLLDIGGWRIWNRRVAFSEIDGDAACGVRGVLYLRGLPWLPWSLRIDELTDESVDPKKLSLRASCLGVHVHLRFDLDPDPSTNQTLLRGALHSDGVLGRLASSSLMPFWHGFLSAALAGMQYAATEAASAAEQK